MKAGKDFIGLGVGAFIINDKNELLLMKRGQATTNRRGMWVIPGGKVEFGELCEHAIVRETKEEVGLDIAVHDVLHYMEDIIDDEGQHWVGPQFRCSIVSGVAENKEPHKCDALKWFSLDNLPEPLAPITQLALKAYLKRK